MRVSECVSAGVSEHLCMVVRDHRGHGILLESAGAEFLFGLFDNLHTSAIAKVPWGVHVRECARVLSVWSGDVWSGTNLARKLFLGASVCHQHDLAVLACGRRGWVHGITSMLSTTKCLTTILHTHTPPLACHLPLPSSSLTS